MQSPFISTFKESVTAMKQKCDITEAVALNLSVDQDTLGALKKIHQWWSFSTKRLWFNWFGNSARYPEDHAYANGTNVTSLRRRLLWDTRKSQKESKDLISSPVTLILCKSHVFPVKLLAHFWHKSSEPLSSKLPFTSSLWDRTPCLSLKCDFQNFSFSETQILHLSNQEKAID